MQVLFGLTYTTLMLNTDAPSADVCIYIYIYIHTYIYIDVCMYVCMYVMYVCMYVCMHACMYVCMYTIYIYIHTYSHIQCTCSYTCTNTHTYISMSSHHISSTNFMIIKRGWRNTVEIVLRKKSNSMKPHPSVVHAHASKLRPAKGFCLAERSRWGFRLYSASLSIIMKMIIIVIIILSLSITIYVYAVSHAV